MAITSGTYDGAQWKGVCDSVSGYFNGYFVYTYNPQYTSSISRLTITEYGVRKIREGPVVWNGATGIVKVEVDGGQTRTTSKSLSTDNANFGSTSPSRVAWWQGTWITDYTRTSSTVTKNIKVTASKSSGTKWGGSASGTFSIDVPARTKYIVSFNGNGATGGATSSKETNLNTATTLPACGFTKTNYSFVSWNTKADGTGTSYNAGASVTFSQDTVLYARWELAYVTPTINITAFRVANGTSGISPTSTGDGTKGFCKVTISGGSYKTGSTPTVNFVFTHKNGDTVVTDQTVNNVSSSGLTYYGYTDDSLLDKDTQYTVTANITITDKNNISRSEVKATYISAEKYTIDIAENQNRICFFGQAQDGATDAAVEIGGDLYLILGTATIDNNLRTAISNLGWTSEVIG